MVDGILIRAVEDDEVPFLRSMLMEAAYWRRGQTRLPLAEALAAPEIARYVEDWGRAGDRALVALDPSTRLIGAAWYRLFRSWEPGYGFVDEQTPELTIAVIPTLRSRGLGIALLRALIGRARLDGYEALSLSVEPDNPARRLYERVGFVPVGSSGRSITMRVAIG